jgi:hypothetical protein
MSSQPVAEPALAEIFRRGDVYADRWSSDVRKALHISDALEGRVRDGLLGGAHVVICGNAGDGKSHLALVAREHAVGDGRRDLIQWKPDEPLPEVPRGAVLYVPDASQFDYDELLRAPGVCAEAEATLLLTINEGPLAVLARKDEGNFFADVRRVVHARASGHPHDDPEQTIVVNLAGRDLTRTDFVGEALQRLLPNVDACPACSSALCPRVIGAQILLDSPAARARLERVIRVLADRGDRVSARDIWVYLVDLFFGWTCPPFANEAQRLRGYWWNRVFERKSALGAALGGEFDPIHAPSGVVDIAIWTGDLLAAGLSSEFPTGIKPSETEGGLNAFRSIKRAWFFLGDVDVEKAIIRQSDAMLFAALVARGFDEPAEVAREVAGLINRFRIADPTEDVLLLSRHHTMTAWRRPKVFAHNGWVPTQELRIKLPYRHEWVDPEGEGIWPRALLASWDDEGHATIRIDFQTWSRLRQPRSLSTDRGQEAVDQALDLFLSQAPGSAPSGETEVVVVDHESNRRTRLSVRATGQRGVVVLE